MGKAHGKGTESVWLPASRGGLESEARRVNQRDDSHGCAAVWQIGTASATVVLDKHAQEVLVRDALGVAGRLDTSHHELVLW